MPKRLDAKEKRLTVDTRVLKHFRGHSHSPSRETSGLSLAELVALFTSGAIARYQDQILCCQTFVVEREN